ncbi:hypothetical protein RJ640_012000 [Escallonia rubra]|uniref:Uncharacterized protein n=1 Tax=Escallonia rubra TaxID=112253 RepID=A0AA88UBA8_9ASTE|nr:hypothetical protein RJ640_012000 [Escallonia rubra]
MAGGGDGWDRAASWAARRTSWAPELAGRGKLLASSGKFSLASCPLKCNAAASYAVAAISGVSKVPSQIRVFVPGSRISDTHFPHFRLRTPRYAEVAPPLLGLAWSSMVHVKGVVDVGCIFPGYDSWDLVRKATVLFVRYRWHYGFGRSLEGQPYYGVAVAPICCLGSGTDGGTIVIGR